MAPLLATTAFRFGKTGQKSKGLREIVAQPFIVNARLPQNINPSFTSTQRPFLISWTWVMVLAR